MTDQSPTPAPKPKRSRRGLLFLLAGLLLGLLAVNVILGATQGPKTVPLSQIMTDITTGQVTEANLNDLTQTITVTTKNGETLISGYPSGYSDTLTKTLLDEKVPTNVKPLTAGPNLLSVFLGFLPVIMIIGFLYWMLKTNAVSGGIGRFGKGRGEAIGAIPETRFSDVAGVDEAVEELRELVEFLADGERFTKVGAKPPRGALLDGPPGTGKTLLARAVAGEAGVPFFALAGSDFVETFVGVGAKRVRELFDKAREAGKAIIFIDEIDAIGRSRSGQTIGGDSERENTLVSMLNEMDGFNATGIIVLAATNRSDVLDPALTRPGRLDRTIHVPLPDRRGRQSILEVHSKGRPMSSDVDFTGLARRTPGFSGAELAQLVNEACMEAGRRGDERVNHDCFASALATVALGKARTSALVTENDRLITAWHEAGHTLTALLIPDADDPVQVSITPRGPAGGVTWMSGSDDLFLTRSGAYAKLTVAMAGRAAEQHLLHGEYTSGAHGDIQSATNLAMAMATQYGMTDLGLAWRPEQMLAAGGGLLDKADEVVNKMLEDSRASAYDILKDNFESLKAIAEGLLDQETLTLAEVRRIHLDVSQKLGKDAELPVKARHGDFEDEEAVPTATTDEGNPEQSLDYTNPAKTV